MQAEIAEVCRIAEQTENDAAEAASIGNSYQQESCLMSGTLPLRIPILGQLLSLNTGILSV